MNLYSTDFNIEGLLLILHLCSNTLKSLTTSCRSVPRKSLMDFNSPLIALEKLDLSSATNLTDEELLHVLNICEPTLKYLDVSYTYLSGDNLSEYKGTSSLPLQTFKCVESEVYQTEVFLTS